ncbi:hypothetical protein, partial [Rhodococcus sp. A14]
MGAVTSTAGASLLGVAVLALGAGYLWARYGGDKPIEYGPRFDPRPAVEAPVVPGTAAPAAAPAVPAPPAAAPAPPGA